MFKIEFLLNSFQDQTPLWQVQDAHEQPECGGLVD